MKKNMLAALILTTLAAGQLTSLQAHAAGQLNVVGGQLKIRG